MTSFVMPALVAGIHVFTKLIPGRAESANPESRNRHRACVWIPGPALARRPGMTSEVDVSQIRTSWPGSSRLRAEASIKWLSCPRPSAGEGPAMTSFLLACPGDVDARDKRGHDGGDATAQSSSFRDALKARTRNPETQTEPASGFRVRRWRAVPE